jgi:L-rhamnose-H+ transport protein
MRVIKVWKWQHIWMSFIVTACLLVPAAAVWPVVDDVGAVYRGAPAGAVTAGVIFGFAWGFGATLFGLCVHLLGVSLGNSMVIGISSALGSVAPLVLRGALRWEPRVAVLLAGVVAFLIGVALCGKAGRLREGATPAGGSRWGYVFAVVSGVLSALFNIGYTLALPVAASARALGHSEFAAANCIWLLMLSAGALPNLGYCAWLLGKERNAAQFAAAGWGRALGLSALMGLLWGASILLYGVATPMLGDIGPSVGWPLMLATALLVANVMGFLLGEWRSAPRAAVRHLAWGIVVLLEAIGLCAVSTRLS